MCGRYELPNTPKSWAELYGLLDLHGPVPEEPSGEVRPTDLVPVVTNADPHELTEAKWWLDGVWSQGRKKLRLINARGDKLEGRFWKKMAETQRCLVPAASFYEWRVVSGQKKKQRVRISQRDDQPLLIAGLWNRWDRQLTFTIVTTSPNELMWSIHDRMPVILSPESARAWLEPEPQPLDELKHLTVPYDPALMTAEDSAEPARAA